MMHRPLVGLKSLECQGSANSFPFDKNTFRGTCTRACPLSWESTNCLHHTHDFLGRISQARNRGTQTHLLGLDRINRPQEFVLIRHAATDMAGTLCGQLDPPLNAMGKEQAGALAALLQQWDVRRLYASPLQRAIQTARPLAELWDIPIVVRRDLREISFGDWEGKRWSQIRAKYPTITTLESSPELGAPGGETFACFRERVLLALKQSLAECDGELIAFVTHQGVIRVLINEISPENRVGGPPKRIDHCSVYRIRVNGVRLELAGHLNLENTLRC
jgi:broad specificity phosphatase PhoE